MSIAAVGLLVLGALGCREAQSAPVYQKIPVTTRDIVVAASAAGVIEPVLTVDMKSKASGEIMDLRFDTGDLVEQGQLVALVDPRNPRNTLAQAQADLQVAEAELENANAQLRRAEQLFQTQSITEQEYEQAKLSEANANARLVRARVTLQTAEDALEDTRVVSPITGTIIEKNVERGQVISSPTRDVGGGTVLMRMANLDTVQVRALIDETDIGKIQPGLESTITVDAFANRPFTGRVLKIEPQATVTQNVTMFPVLVRIDNSEGLLKPGMSAEVEVHVGRRDGVLTVPNAALRTERDVASAAVVLDLDPDDVQQQLADARERRRAAADSARFGGGGRAHPDSAEADGSPRRMRIMGFEARVPEGYTEEQVRHAVAKLRTPGGRGSLTPAERTLLRKLREANPQQGGRRPPRSAQFGGSYIVFTLRDGVPQAVPIRTGLTDLDHSEVVSGLSEGDTVLVLPSLSLLESQEAFRNRIGRFTGLPGVSNNQQRSQRSQGRRQ